jgi:hypothetical protein
MSALDLNADLETPRKTGRFAATGRFTRLGASPPELAHNQLADSRPAIRGKEARSRITNGKVLVSGVDQRSEWVRRCKDIIELHLSDLGGSDNCSEAERSIVRRCAVLTTQLEQLEVKFAQAEGAAFSKDLDLYVRASGNLRRLLAAVGLRRRAKDVTPTLGEYLQTINAEDGSAE